MKPNARQRKAIEAKRRKVIKARLDQLKALMRPHIRVQPRYKHMSHAACT
jgi:hypothetical protein